MKKQMILRRICASLLAVGMCACFLVPAKAAVAATPVVSYGMSVLAAATDVAVSAPAGNDIVFSADVFARGLNLSRVQYITVCSLPSETDGELLLGATRVAVGQTISEANLSHLCFAPADGVARASFTFSANGSATPLVCNLYLLEGRNTTPTVSMAPKLALEASTYRDMALAGTVSAYEPDGDDMVFEIVTYPQNGSVLLTDAEIGAYTYKPAAGYAGSDSFSYVARDRYGNYSAKATVVLNVEVCGTSVVYADLEDPSETLAAMKVTEAGIMSGTQVGDGTYFYPNRTLSRVEFLVMAMKAAGIESVPECESTVFADDAQIPAGMKGYVAAAYQLGLINGSDVEGSLCFLPEDSITRAQAAVILHRLVGEHEVSVLPVFADSDAIPSWAREAIYSLNAGGILTSEAGYISPDATLTRGMAARLLAAQMEYGEN